MADSPYIADIENRIHMLHESMPYRCFRTERISFMMPGFKHIPFSPIILFALIAAAGCAGLLTRGPGTMYDIEAVMSDHAEGNPDNCSKCHAEWAERFDYFRGWDRYGYIYGDRTLIAAFDPWLEPDVHNVFRDYYATGWWKSPDNEPWPGNITDSVMDMSIISHPSGFPDIPRKLGEIEGPVEIVDINDSNSSSIQAAVDRSGPGTTIYVRPGEYHEAVRLKTGISLIGEDPYTTIINPLNTGHGIVAANNSIIAGFTLTGTGIDYETRAFNAAVYVAGCDSTCIITGNIFRENGLFGVWIDGVVDEDEYRDLRDRVGGRRIEMADPVCRDYPNPIVAGNTFYRIGQRGVFCVHSRGEIFNNVFSGNVKAVGMERHARPLFHHNVCYFNNVPMAVNRSEPVVFNNIMELNQWGQRMLRGANPVIFNNVTWNSPHFRDFDENGRPILYPAHPGFGERSLDPRFTNPRAGVFTFSDQSPLAGMTNGYGATGIMRDSGLPQPPDVKVADSYGREVLAMSDDIVELIGHIETENAKIRSLDAAYDIHYEGYLDIETNMAGEPLGYRRQDPDHPVVRVDYHVPEWRMNGDNRYKKYEETITRGGTSHRDRGVVTFNGSWLQAESGRFSELYGTPPDERFIGERPFRENPGGFYRDYDQYVKGAIGPTGTFYNGYFRIMGGAIQPERTIVDGHEVIVVRYPHIGKDQYYLFYLDPKIGYRPRLMEQYYLERLYRRVDDYVYENGGGAYVPTHVTVTDYAAAGPFAGKPVAVCELDVLRFSLNQ